MLMLVSDRAYPAPANSYQENFAYVGTGPVIFLVKLLKDVFAKFIVKFLLL